MALSGALKCINGNISSKVLPAGSLLTGIQSLPCQSVERFFSTSQTSCKYYVKPNYLKRWARRDQKRRELFAEYESKRGRLRMISKCDILPSGVREKAAAELAELPRDSCISRIRNRCVLTDRGRGNVGRFRINRMQFKEFAEKGLIAGVQRSQW